MPNTHASLAADLAQLGLERGAVVMVHSAFGKIGYTIGGPVTMIRALLDVLGPGGTLVMPAETPQLLDPASHADARVKPEWHDAIRAHLPAFDPRTTPTTMGAIPEAFRTFPDTRRSDHPLVSVCANGRQAAAITAAHAREICEGRGTPFEVLYALDAMTLLAGVGFDRCTSLHYAESLVPARRTMVNRYLDVVDGQRRWVDRQDMATDGGVHFPIVGQQFIAAGGVRAGRIGDADAMLFSTRALVDFAAAYFARVLAHGSRERS